MRNPTRSISRKTLVIFVVIDLLIIFGIFRAVTVPLETRFDANCSDEVTERFSVIRFEREDYNTATPPDPPGPAELCAGNWTAELYLL